ncbi:MAG: hypothetical protein PHC88_00740 [Terrimicrobiaceae bacterium]|nr:hypothetical protein [Terrimicrobiaceae bacterium]
MPLKLLCVVAVAIAAAGSGNAQTGGDGTVIDKAALIKELKAIQAKQANTRRERFDSLAVKLLAAAKSDDSAVRLYADSVHDADFSANSGDSYRFQTWRENNKALLTKNKAFAAAARLHLRYLAISLKRAADSDGKPPLAELWDYVTALSGALSEFGGEMTATDPGRAMLDRPITSSPIVRANLLTGELEKLHDWEMTAGSLEGILEKDIRTSLRAQKDPHLLDTWKLQIEFQSANAEKSRGDVQRDTFAQVEFPRLLWRQARDMIVIDEANRGLLEMTKLVRAYPTHPDLAAWVAELTALLQSPQPEGKN